MVTEAAAASTKTEEATKTAANPEVGTEEEEIEADSVVAVEAIKIGASRTTVSEEEEVAATSAAAEATLTSVVVAAWLTGVRTDTRTIVAASAAEAVATIGTTTKAIVARERTTELMASYI